MRGRTAHTGCGNRTDRFLRSTTLALSAAAWFALVALGTLGSPVSAIAAGPPLVVTATVTPDTATVGDRLVYTLEIDRAESVSVALPDFVTALAPFEVLDAAPAAPEERGDRVVERQELVVAAFETGELTLPALEFGYETASGDSGVAFSDSLAVTIKSVLPEVREDQQAGPLDIKPPLNMPRNWWPLIIGVLALAALAVAGHYLRRWLMSRSAENLEEEVPEEPRVPRIAAHLVALSRLDELEREDPIGRGDIPAFYVRVTEIIRFYLRDRFGVDAIDMTTTELPAAMREARIGEAEVVWSVKYLAHADLAKFAKHVPAEERARADMREAREFVERTRLSGEDDGGVGSTDDREDQGANDGGRERGDENTEVSP